MEPTKQPLPGKLILSLVAMGLAVLVIANDFTALSVALPAIEADFKSGITTVQWIINGYAMVFGVLIVTGGRLAGSCCLRSGCRGTLCRRQDQQRKGAHLRTPPRRQRLMPGLEQEK